MSKPKPIYIHIPEPCSQNWADMTPDADGRHCAHCQKTVVDFTGYSDAALYRYFSKNTGHVCGRFLTTQVDRPIAIPYQPHSKLYRMTVALGLVLLFTQTPEVLAQNRPPKKEQNVKSRPVPTTLGEIAGHIVDGQKVELINALVQVYQGDILKGSGLTDYDGNFIIRALEAGNYEIVVSSKGFDTVRLTSTVTAALRTTLNFTMGNGRKVEIKTDSIDGVLNRKYIATLVTGAPRYGNGYYDNGYNTTKRASPPRKHNAKQIKRQAPLSDTLEGTDKTVIEREQYNNMSH